jgi:hypothetical protein
VAIDGPSGAHDDESERGGDSKPAKGREHDPGEAGQPTDARAAEVRSRADYYKALRATDQRMTAELPADATRTRAAWDVEADSGHPDPPPLDSLHVAPERAKHILDGDRWGGGHRHGTGRPGKTEFPSNWDDDRIIRHVLDAARAPDDPPVFQANRRWRVHGQREDVGINVIVQPDGRIWSAWPDAGGPGVVKNPRETQ